MKTKQNNFTGKYEAREKIEKRIEKRQLNSAERWEFRSELQNLLVVYLMEKCEGYAFSWNDDNSILFASKLVGSDKRGWEDLKVGFIFKDDPAALRGFAPCWQWNTGTGWTHAIKEIAPVIEAFCKSCE